METPENDLKTLFLIFCQVLQFCESHYSVTDAEILFKSARILEETFLKLESLGALKEFETKLNEYFALKGIHNISLTFFKDVSQTVLSKYITNNNFTDGQVKIAIKEFVFNKSDKELFNVIHNLTATQHSVDILKQNTSISQYNAAVLFTDLVIQLTNLDGNIKKLESLILKLVSDNKDNFKVLLNVLCLSSNCEVSASVQDVVSFSINNLLRDHKNIFLYACVVGLCEKNLHKIVSRWDSFIETFISVVEFSIKKLQCSYSENSYTWNHRETEIALHFEDIIVFINKLKPLPELCEKIKQSLFGLRNEGFVLIVEDLWRTCKIK